MQVSKNVVWQLAEVTSPRISHPVAVVVARDIPYIKQANRLQNLNIYLARSDQTSGLEGTQATAIPAHALQFSLPRIHVHIHGGAWRDPQLLSTSIEADVAHAFSVADSPIVAIISINYTLTHFPTHPTLPYDTAKDDHADPAREAVHPTHIHDVLSAFALLREFGLKDDSYILSGHSAGACLAFQASLASPQHWASDNLPSPPRPAALLGMNGLYDLPDLVHNLGPSHAHLEDVYKMLLENAFGADQSKWPAVSPARFDIETISKRVRDGQAPTLVVVDESKEDQLVPMNQMEKMMAHLGEVNGMNVVRGYRCTGVHAAPWEQGVMIWESILDILKLLGEDEK